MADRLTSRKRRIQCRAVSGDIKVDGKRQICLIDISSANRIMNVAERLGISRLVPAGLKRGDSTHLLRQANAVRFCVHTKT